ncbi:DUF2570 family protein [Marinobacter sp. CA1]|uniref:DUF2570 family protein n=1 Tax=Marinobacter sp. CA1 TaxID=2817656 RepID=UPI001D06A977|nr:DUF2570 family protein [Marinobacter sp. CA1]UDL03992.1 DUF2570 family protein [Marinobacter sp. CA1]
MIGKLISAKALPWVAGGITLVLALMGGAIWFLMQERDSLNQRAGELEALNQQHAEVIRQQSEDYTELKAELKRRDEAVSKAAQERQAAERYARDQIERLRNALAKDVCADTRHPGVVADVLRAGPGDSEKD